MSRPKKRIFQLFNRTRPIGRPRGRFNLYDDVKTIVKIAEQYHLHPQELATSLSSARKHHSSFCGPLTIHSRGQSRDAIVFMISYREQIVSQFTIRLDVLRNTEYYFR